MSEYPANGPIVSVAVTALAEVATIPVRGGSQLVVQLVVGAAALTDFQVEGRCHRLATYSVLATAAGDFTTPVYPIRKASGDLNTAAAGATSHYLIMDVAGLSEVKISAASGTSSTVVGYWGVT